jgi:DNA-binding NtrC family response regulator
MNMTDNMTRTNSVTRVLVIEDDHHLRDLLEVVLDLEHNVEVATLADERQAVEAYRRYQPDVVVLDLMLPHISGEEVAAQLKAERSDVRIISISGLEPTPRPWADEQVVKSGTMVEELHAALARDRARHP